MGLCSTCIMPGSSPVVFLDDEGVCSHCRNYQHITYLGEAALTGILDRSRSEAGEYDCMVNISGGRDSAYALLSLVKDYHMRVLAVNYANPFTTPQAKKNIENMVRILGVDFVRFSLKNRIHERILSRNVLAWFKSPSAAMVPAVCIGCKIIWPDILKIARGHRITCIVNGGNPYEYTSFKKQLLGVSANANLNATYSANIVGLLRESLKNLSYLSPQYLLTTAKGYLFGNQYAIGSRVLGRGIRRIDLFHYLPWDESRVISRIQAELDWDYPRDQGSTWRFDCNIAHLKDFMYMRTLGVTEKHDFYSKMVREGQITRAQALTSIGENSRLHLDTIYEVFSELGITDINLEKESSVFAG